MREDRDAVRAFSLTVQEARLPQNHGERLQHPTDRIPHLMERLHEHYELFPDQLPHLKRDPVQYMASDRCFYTVEPGEKMIPVVAGIVGQDRLMYASGYAHFDCMCPESVEAIADRDDLSRQLKRKLLGANAARLFNLKG